MKRHRGRRRGRGSLLQLSRQEGRPQDRAFLFFLLLHGATAAAVAAAAAAATTTTTTTTITTTTTTYTTRRCLTASTSYSASGH